MKKISIIIPNITDNINYEECCNSIIEQSYSDYELLIINNSLDNKVKTSLIELSKKDDRIRIINSTTSNIINNIIIGIKASKNEYISLINATDYIDIDYYRLMINNMIINDSDIIVSNFVKDINEKKITYSLTFNMNNKIYDNNTFYDIFIKQTGRNNRYNIIWNKLIKKELIDKVLTKYSSIKIDRELDPNILISTIIYKYAKKVSFCDEAIYYINTKNTNNIITNSQYIDNRIDTINNSFKYVAEFLKKEKLYLRYKEDIEIWNSFCIARYIDLFKQNKKIKKIKYDYENDEKLINFNNIKRTDNSWNNYKGVEMEYTEEFSEIKKMIMNPNIKIVSFDMFDTLITRPFFIPNEMFCLLNKLFIKTFDLIKALDFSKIRIESERNLRKIYDKKGIVEITLDEIYDYISKNYNLDSEKLKKIKEKEIEMELFFCRRRNSGYELYSLAKHMKKKLILVSDMYLPEKVLKKILDKTDYTFDEFYVSSTLKKNKSSGSMYEYVIEKEGTKDIVHIGDNYDSDYLKPKEYDIKSAYLPKAIFIMMGYEGKKVGHCGNLYRYFMLLNQDHIPYEETFGVRCSLGIIANYYFDNPYRPYNSITDFNADPYFIGYYALGMQLISMCKWLLEDAKSNRINSIAFMARDGYLPYTASKIYKTIVKKYDNIKINYTYVSRKSLMPLLLKEKSGISLIDTYVDYDSFTPKDIIEQLSFVLTTSNKIEMEINNRYSLDEKFTNKEDFNDCISLIYDMCFDEKKFNNYYNICKKYFDKEFEGNSAAFDIGYSGKPEAIISSIINKPVRTYFIHSKNSTAFNNMNKCDSQLITFYDFKPVVTGSIREYFISSIESSCIGYKIDNEEIKPILKKYEKYSYYNLDMINRVQEGSLAFVRDFTNYFKDYINDIDTNKYYMSLPLEYYFHYTNIYDKIPTKDLLFENNTNSFVEMNDYVFGIYEKYQQEFSLGSKPQNGPPEINYSLPKSRISRLIYYLINDRDKIKKKIIESLKPSVDDEY